MHHHHLMSLKNGWKPLSNGITTWSCLRIAYYISLACLVKNMYMSLHPPTNRMLFWIDCQLPTQKVMWLRFWMVTVRITFQTTLIHLWNIAERSKSVVLLLRQVCALYITWDRAKIQVITSLSENTYDSCFSQFPSIRFLDSPQ